MYNVFIFFTLSLKAFMVFSDCEARKQKTYSDFSLLNRANQACKKFPIVISTALSCMQSVDPKESTDAIMLSHYLFFFLPSCTLLQDLQKLHVFIMTEKYWKNKA